MSQTFQQFLNKLALINTIIGLVGVVVVLAAALVMQFFLRRTTMPFMFATKSSICQYWDCVADEPALWQ